MAEHSGKYESPMSLFGPSIAWNGPSEQQLSKLAIELGLEIATIQQMVGSSYNLTPYESMTQRMQEIDCIDFIPEMPFIGCYQWEESIMKQNAIEWEDEQ